MRLVNDKRLMIPVTVFLAVCVIGLTVLLVLDSTGALYGSSTDKGKNPPAVDGIGGEQTLLDGKLHESGEYQYRLYTDGTAELYYYDNGKATEVNVPSEIDGYKISAIGDECFVWMPSLTRVTIPDGITRIGAEAFSGCGNLVDLRLPKTLTMIGADAFKGCSSAMRVEYGGDISKVIVGTGNDALLSAIGIEK